ncbi:Tetratricopeptide repeat,Zinc finger, MYND-type,Tetratricopeptide-like helical domain,SET domain [Cinara cedri]|uniref:Protein-lysine N-methyltransferase SMYD4 n=1 Tax=Cinara cedri TaxID=506608 RepID=A0A5E4N8N0_9HEMI|nr:Tetratricopeptide repeat,Zinc finger, MYND-type,Tetratricopeptide-like helical domain,SET domain [Cinara cedri]
MFVPWDSLLEIITHYSSKNKFLDIFGRTTHDKKISLCMEDTFIRNCLEQWLASDEFNDSLKNTEKSKFIRFKANREFEKDYLEKCCKLYTKAAQYALYNSMEYALAFSNRSAVYMKLKRYEDCLKDIDISLNVLENLDIPLKQITIRQIIVKLLKRKINCLIALKHYKKGRMCWDHLLAVPTNMFNASLEVEFKKNCQVLFDYDGKEDPVENIDGTIEPKPTISRDFIEDVLKKENKILPFKSSKLKLCYTETKGNHFIASNEIKYGELLMFENPFAFVLLPEFYNEFCYNCFLKLKHSIPCEHCSAILFCSEKCRQESWDSFHCWECKQGPSILKCIGIAHLALRLSFKTLNPSSKNTDQIYNLLTHIDDLDPIQLLQYSLTATLLLLYLKNKTDYFIKHPNLDIYSVGKDLLYHMTRLVCNGNAISTHLLSDSNSNNTIEEIEPRIGTAIFPTSSLLNHSCNPNIFSSNVLNYVVIKATRIIKEGEEITNCYGPHFQRMRYSERQKVLKKQYHFECDCIVCINPRDENKFYQIFEGLKCLSCYGETKETLDDLVQNNLIACHFCYKIYNAADYRKVLSLAEKFCYEGMIELEKNNLKNAFFSFEKSLKFYDRALNENNLCVAKVCNNIARCYASSGQFTRCYTYLMKSFRTIEKRFGAHSLEVAYEMDKISDVILMNMENNKQFINQNIGIATVLNYVRKSMNIFNARLSAWNIPYNEPNMEQLKYKQELFLKMLE